MNVKNQSHFIYTKSDAKLISGIAIWLMFIHHFWGFPEWLNEGNICIPFLKFGDVNVEQIFAISCKLCVAIFAFNTGYVLYLKKEEYTFRNNLKRIFKFLVSYWVIYFLFLFVGYLASEDLPSITHLCLNLIGLDCGPQKYINVPFAWYVCYYIFFILLTPIILACMKHKNYLKDIFFIIFWICLLQMSVVSQNYFGQTLVIKVLNYLLPIGLISLCAFIVAKYDLFNMFLSFMGCNVFKNLFLVIGIFIYKSTVPYLLFDFVGHDFIIYQDCFLAFLFVYAFVNLLHHLNNNLTIKKMLYFSGIYSMNLWFLHGIFFTGTNKLQWIPYLPKYSFLVLIFGFLLIYPIAVLIQRIQSGIFIKLKL